MNPEFNPLDNRLLAALPQGELRRWRTVFEPVELRLGQTLYEPGRTPPGLYFPTTAVVSVLCPTRDGDCDEVAVIGREGVVGVSLLMDGESTPGRAVVQSAGRALRLPAWAAREAFEHSAQVLHLMLRYSLALGAQVAQISVCNRRHPLEQRMRRRLLQAVDRQPGRELAMTHEQLASLLGVRRESVTTEAHKLQKAGCVQYTRGHLLVVDRAGLALHACECHAAAEAEYNRLLPSVAAPVEPAIRVARTNDGMHTANARTATPPPVYAFAD